MDSVKTDLVQEKIKRHPKRRFNSTKNQTCNQNGVKRRKNELITIASQLKAFRRELPIWKGVFVCKKKLVVTFVEEG